MCRNKLLGLPGCRRLRRRSWQNSLHNAMIITCIAMLIVAAVVCWAPDECQDLSQHSTYSSVLVSSLPPWCSQWPKVTQPASRAPGLPWSPLRPPTPGPRPRAVLSRRTDRLGQTVGRAFWHLEPTRQPVPALKGPGREVQDSSSLINSRSPIQVQLPALSGSRTLGNRSLPSGHSRSGQLWWMALG